MSVTLSKDTNRSANQQLKDKVCGFPGCKVKFKGRGKTKYCDEHRKQKYKKILYQPKKKKSLGDANQKIKHKFTESTDTIRTCALEGCEREYKLRLIPNQEVYPKYCPEHRNEWKREIFTRKLNKGEQE